MTTYLEKNNKKGQEIYDNLKRLPLEERFKPQKQETAALHDNSNTGAKSSWDFLENVIEKVAHFSADDLHSLQRIGQIIVNNGMSYQHDDKVKATERSQTSSSKGVDSKSLG